MTKTTLKIVTAIPVDEQIPYNTAMIPNNNDNINKCISYSYSVKVISCIQIFFNILTAMSNPYFLFQALFSFYLPLPK